MPASKPIERERSTHRTRIALLVAAPSTDVPDREVERSLDEMEQLLRGLGIAVRERIVQKRSRRAGATYVGEGKLRELAALTGGTGELTRRPASTQGTTRASELDLVVVDDELSPGQQRALELATGAEILDRTAVILEVFRRRARTREAQLEVELARLEYELPRIRDDATLGDREGGGGRASRGHTNVELAKQRVRQRGAAIRRELEALNASTATRRLRRAEAFRVALIGYTNAGKSSLMRLLTGSDVLVEDRLFATLGPTVRQLSPPTTPPILVADTVGFIDRLPHALVASFRSTLDEVHESSLLLHVVDASDPAFLRQLEVSEDVVRRLGASDTPAIVLLNKVDRLDDVARRDLANALPNALQVSALSAHDGAALRERIIAFFDDRLVTARLDIPYARRGVLGDVREQVRVLSEEYGAVITVEIRTTPEALARLRKRLD